MGGNLQSHTTLEDLLRDIEHAIAEINPSKILVVGTCAGGLAALALAERINPARVHLFSPFTYLNWLNIIRNLDYKYVQKPNIRKSLYRLKELPPEQNRYYDGAEILKRIKDDIPCYVHFGRYQRHDSKRAFHLKRGNAILLAHGCKEHMIAKFLLRKGGLQAIFDLENEWHPELMPRGCF